MRRENDLITWFTFIIGFTLVVGGIYVAILNHQADSTLQLLGQEITTSSIGLALAFIGVVLVALTFRKILALTSIAPKLDDRYSFCEISVVVHEGKIKTAVIDGALVTFISSEGLENKSTLINSDIKFKFPKNLLGETVKLNAKKEGYYLRNDDEIVLKTGLQHFISLVKIETKNNFVESPKIIGVESESQHHTVMINNIDAKSACAKINLSNIDFSHCLRINLTPYILKELIQQRSAINLIGSKGIGRSRLLEDLKKCDIPNTLVIKVDMKSYRLDYESFLDDIATQLKVKRSSNLLLPLFDDFEKTSKQMILLLMDNFDAIVDYPEVDNHYDGKFASSLNNLNNRDNVSLLFVTKKPQKSIAFGGITSLLDFSPILMDLLLESEVEKELQRKLNNHPIFDTENKSIKMEIINLIIHNAYPYSLLQHFINKLTVFNRFNFTEFESALQDWKQAYMDAYQC
jgi:hypothetical protein